MGIPKVLSLLWRFLVVHANSFVSLAQGRRRPRGCHWRIRGSGNSSGSTISSNSFSISSVRIDLVRGIDKSCVVLFAHGRTLCERAVLWPHVNSRPRSTRLFKGTSLPKQPYMGRSRWKRPDRQDPVGVKSLWATSCQLVRGRDSFPKVLICTLPRFCALLTVHILLVDSQEVYVRSQELSTFVLRVVLQRPPSKE